MVAALVAVGVGDALAQGCAMCQTALGGADDPLAEAVGMSVLFMMAMPYVVVASVGAWLYLAHRRAVSHPDKGDLS
jgi:hypothetical protein